MAKTISLKAEPRALSGTTASKAVRKAGKVPAIIYGRHHAPQSLQLDAHTLALSLHGGTEHLLVDLEIVGGGKMLALIQDVQHHPVKRHIVHLDFHALKEDEVMHTSVPIIGMGEPLGVKTGGGLLHQIIRALEVECLPLTRLFRLEPCFSLSRFDAGSFAATCSFRRFNVKKKNIVIIIIIIIRGTTSTS